MKKDIFKVIDPEYNIESELKKINKENISKDNNNNKKNNIQINNKKKDENY